MKRKRLNETMTSLIYYIVTIFVIILVIAGVSRNARAAELERLNLVYRVSVEYQSIEPEGQRWIEAKSTTIDGMGGFQFHLDESLEYRMVVHVEKPFDLGGTLKLRTPTKRTGVTLVRGSKEGRLILGPHDGCSQSACDPLSRNDVGQFQLQMNLEKATTTSFGAYLVRPFVMPAPIVISPGLKYKDSVINCGETVKKGWWIFAKKLEVHADPIGTISLCVETPDKEVHCADDQEQEIKIRANQSGPYKFFVWSEKIVYQHCEIQAR